MSNCEGTEEKIYTKIITIKPAFKNNLTSLWTRWRQEEKKDDSR